jgi:hypothetical protein
LDSVAKFFRKTGELSSEQTLKETDNGQAFRGNGKLTPEQEEIRHLKDQVKRLEMGVKF